MFPKLSENKLENGFDIWPLLTLVITVVDIMFLSFYFILKDLWEHTHTTTLGYLFVCQVVFWIGNSVYLSEGINLYFSSKEGKGQKISIKEYLKAKVKEI